MANFEPPKSTKFGHFRGSPRSWELPRTSEKVLRSLKNGQNLGLEPEETPKNRNFRANLPISEHLPAAAKRYPEMSKNPRKSRFPQVLSLNFDHFCLLGRPRSSKLRGTPRNPEISGNRGVPRCIICSGAPKTPNSTVGSMVGRAKWRNPATSWQEMARFDHFPPRSAVFAKIARKWPKIPIPSGSKPKFWPIFQEIPRNPEDSWKFQEIPGNLGNPRKNPWEPSKSRNLVP